MSQYEEEMDGNNIICPYCRHEYQPEGEDFGEDERIEECEDCGSKFYHHDEVTYEHHTRPDCEINGEDHKWYTIVLRSGDKHDFCEVCGIIRPLNDEQKKAIKEAAA